MHHNLPTIKSSVAQRRMVAIHVRWILRVVVLLVLLVNPITATATATSPTAVTESKVKVKTWTKAYPAFGKFVLSSKSSVIVLMNDMGCQLTQSKPKTHSEFCLEYLSMMEETINVQKLLRLVHGDIHQGNFVYEEAAPAGLCKLRLIDWDEASNRRPMKRNVVTKVQKERFPDNLLKDAEAYTNTQLFLLFRDISKELYNMNVHMDDTGIVKCSNEQCADGKKSSVTQTTAGEAKQRYESLKAFLTKKQKEAMSS